MSQTRNRSASHGPYLGTLLGIRAVPSFPLAGKRLLVNGQKQRTLLHLSPIPEGRVHTVSYEDGKIATTSCQAIPFPRWTHVCTLVSYWSAIGNSGRCPPQCQSNLA